jgi:uncharacterized protein YjiS (DUF1127 family)
MPCRDYYDDHPEAYFRDVKEPALKKQISFAESALCLTLRKFQETLERVEHWHERGAQTNPLDIMSDEDFADAGITRKELEKWWKNHKKLDAEHREQERLKKLKESALAKLSDEERKVLGLK